MTTNINWDVFFENSSTAEVLYDFAIGHYDAERLREDCWPEDCKAEALKIAKANQLAMRQEASKRLRAEGWPYPLKY